MKKLKKIVIEAIEYYKQNPTKSLTKIGEIFQVDRHSISKYLKNDEYLLYKFNNKSNLTDEYVYYFEQNELNFIQLYINNPTISYNELITKINGKAPSRRTLYSWLAILGYEKTEGQSIKYHYNRNAFSTIDTEEDAYWLGFITTDGCIIDNKWLQIQLAAKDKEHLVKFCKYIGLPTEEIEEIIKDSVGGAYTRDNPVNVVKICSVDIINHLLDKGITPRKSGKEKPYICKNVELEKAYIRGLIDGDGYIGSTQYRLGLVGSYEICDYVKQFITKNIKDISQHEIYQHGVIFKLDLTGRKQSIQILKFLYDNANIYLDRKYSLAQSYINNNMIAVVKLRN